MKQFTILDKARGVFDQRFAKKVTNRRIYRDRLAGKKGVEIGGPSRIFTDEGNLPLYDVIGGLDGCNYSEKTVWNEEMKEGEGQYRYGDGKTGAQFTQEASNLNKLKDGAYDFLLASHVLEHCANPLKTLEEWQRVVKNDGYLLIVLPHKDGTFDHRRPVTTLRHMIADYEADMKEDDMTHLGEILKLHDFKYDKGTADVESLKERSVKNLENRCMHHHVFTALSAATMVDHAGLKIIDADVKRPYHIVLLTQKTIQAAKPDNSRFLRPEYFQAVSPFGI